MNLLKGFKIPILLIIISFWIMIFSIYDILFNKEWTVIIFICYIIIILMLILFIFIKMKYPDLAVYEFEKTLQGGLYHYKCPMCDGYFAIKKSKSNDDKPFKMTCPDCGKTGMINVKKIVIDEEIPEEKSNSLNYECNNCGEQITIWAEGTEIIDEITLYSCPYCGILKPLEKK